MAFLAPLISTGISALGGLFGNRQQTSPTTSNSTINPILDPNAKNLLNPLVNNYIGLLNSDPNLEGYKTSQGQDIANLYANLKKQTTENLATKGITSGPAVASAESGIDSQRIAELSKLSESIPLLKDQLIQQLTQTGTSLFSAIPRGSQTVGTGTVTQPGNQLGGLFGNLDPGSIMRLLQGLFGGSGSNTTNTTGGPAAIFT